MTIVVVIVSVVAYLAVIYFLVAIAGAEYLGKVTRKITRLTTRPKQGKVILPPRPAGGIIPPPPMVPVEFAGYPGMAKFTRLRGAANIIDSEQVTMRLSKYTKPMKVSDYSEN